MLLAAATPTLAADDSTSKGKESHPATITGDAKCAKCTLKEADKCQTVVEAEGRNGHMVKYYLVDNEIAKNFHENVCKEPKKVKVTGTVKRTEDGKRELTATKIELAKDEKGEKKAD
jgi:hypothetical protein